MFGRRYRTVLINFIVESLLTCERAKSALEISNLKFKIDLIYLFTYLFTLICVLRPFQEYKECKPGPGDSVF